MITLSHRPQLLVSENINSRLCEKTKKGLTSKFLTSVFLLGVAEVMGFKLRELIYALKSPYRRLNLNFKIACESNPQSKAMPVQCFFFNV